MPLKLTRRKGAANWYVRGTIRGQKVFETTGTDKREAAETYRIKKENLLLESSVFGRGATHTFVDAAISYLEEGGEAKYLGAYDHAAGKWSLLIGHFGDEKLAMIGQEQVDEAARKLYPNAGPATRKRHAYVPMSAVLNHAARLGWCAAPKLRHPRVDETVTRWSTPERLAKLLPHCAPALRLLVVLLTYTGARLSEALAIDWDKDVDLNQRTIILPKTKNGKMRALHIPDPLLLELAGVDEGARHGAMFHWSDKRHVHKPLRSACKRAGVDYLPPHQQGRHTYATWLRSYAGLDLAGIKEAGGWKSIQSVVRYAHVAPGEAARAADRLPSVHSACTKVVDVSKRRKIKRKIA